MFDTSKNIFRRVTRTKNNSEEFQNLDENNPNPRDFHQAVFDEETSQMYVIGGSEAHGKVNYIHQFNWSPFKILQNTSDPSSFIQDMTTNLYSEEKQIFSNFEMIFKDEKGSKVATFFCPEAFIKFRCPRLYK